AHVHTSLGFHLTSTPYTRDNPAALAHFRAAKMVLGQGVDGSSMGSLYTGLASALLYGVRVVEGLAASRKAMEIAERLRDPALWAIAARLHGAHTVGDGRLAEGLALIERAWVAADRLNDAVAAYWAAVGRGLVAARLLGDPRDARAWYE